ncbi:universal stress protein [Allomuricauda sp. F6463D]|uniref:universal stress protein n=1 Tax=Allomuricauda sp. F6463D TaxID=2926409 RepID=UPI001FF4AF3A|nr:universal stress protein [Muricauda sp. F6463D]MCK0159249.1 universal stress protein [Muricauda sp. F6463D]
MDKRVLLPTDYSKNALNAIRYAMELYKNVRCEFYVLNAFHISGYTLDSMRVPETEEPYYEAAKKESEEEMQRLMKMLELYSQNDKHKFHTITTLNNFIQAVEVVIDKKDIDMIVMGTKGITGSTARIFGSNTVNIMEQIKECPVIAVPNNYRFETLREIVFPTDYKTPFKKKEIGDLIELSKIHDAKINVVHIDKDKEEQLGRKEKENKELLQEILQGTDYEMHFLQSDKISMGINNFIGNNDCDMVAFLNRKHLFLESVLTNPFVKKIGFDPQVPILEMNDN